MATKTGGKTIFGEKCQFTLRTKIFIKITLSSTISKITPLECFMYNFKMAAKNSRKTIFSKNCQNTTHIKPGGKIIHQNHSISHHAEIQDGSETRQENDFWQTLPDYCVCILQVKKFVKITLSRTVSKINAFLCFMLKFKTDAKNGGKTIFGKKCLMTLHVPCRLKILFKSLYLTPFLRYSRFFIVKKIVAFS